MKNAILFVIFSLFSLSIYAQNEASTWYFGENAGIKFNIFTGGVTPLSDGQINTREGCASISDSSGQLLFYTDGTTVYNSVHDVMPNGNDLLGDESSAQSAIVVPKPNEPNIYYIFTVGSNQTLTGLNYSIVDVSANSGAGEVTRKNTNLIPDCAEKISAVVKDCDTKSIWVIALSTASGFIAPSSSLNTFYAFEINGFGVNSIPIKSTLPITISDRRGYLKLSPSGSKLACANVISGLFLFDFDSDSGLVRNSNQINIDGINNKPYGIEFSPNSELLYVTSTNNFFDRINSANNDNPANHTSVLLQYDLNATDIESSQVVIDNRNLYRSALQLGPNGKIYRSLSETYNKGLNGLGAINNPNVIGTAASYQHDAVNLGSRNSTQGLPPFIASFFNEQIDIIKNGNSTAYLSLCEDDSYTLVVDNIPGAKYIWTRDDILLPESDFDLVLSKTGLYSESGVYKVVIEPLGTVITNSCGFPQGQATVQFFDYPTAMDASLFQCDLDLSSIGITTFNLTEANEIITNPSEEITVTFHNTANDATNGANAILHPGNYENNHPNELLFTRVTHNFSGCFETATLSLGVSNTQVPTYKAEPVCDEEDSPDGLNLLQLKPYEAEILNGLLIPITDARVKFFKTLNDALVEENEILEFQNTTPYAQTIFYRVETTSNNECFGINEIELTIDKLPDIVENETIFYCLNTYPQTISIDAALINDTPNNYTYNWSNGESDYEIQINEAGTYTVDVINANGCFKTRTVIIKPSNTATFSTPSFNINNEFSSNVSVTVFINEDSLDTYQFALLGADNQIYRGFQDSNIFENIYPGIYTINVKEIKNNCGTIDLPVSVIGYPKFFTPNNDGVNDTWQILGVSEQFQSNSLINIYDRFGKLLKQISPTEKGWNGTLNGNVLPADDYWFSVKLEDGRLFKNHFTLKY
ncbi:T9SS type B sorting domain-containing protein [uncultured Algibacter sp.]|uniref:T9SS type B sorting domain-containing protein n=1 Tax=uncultured Algibacter sp. TaxID=298659 RepID=UPI00260FA450|nr:T9SS type B sorting domain-containing protein [uncultured Algibacter sp.]